MVNVPISPPCCVVVADSKNTGKTLKRRRLSGESHANCFKRYKCTLLIGTVILLLLTLLRLLLYFVTNEHAYNPPVGSESESREERIIRLSYPLDRESLTELETEERIDRHPLFADQSPPPSQETEVVGDDALLTMNEETRVAARRKRETSRRRRECKLNEEHCKTLLKSMKIYFEGLGDKAKYTPSDIIKCLQCKNLQMDAANEIDKEVASRPYNQYFPHEHMEQNRSSDFGMPIVKLLDEDSKRRTESPKMQSTTEASFPAKSSPNKLPIKKISFEQNGNEMATVPVNHMSAWFRPQVYTKPFNISTANVSDTQPANSSIAFKHTQTQVGPLRTGSFEGIPSNGSGSVPVDSNIDVTAENKNATNVSPQFTTTEASFPADKPPIKKISFEQNGNEMATVPVNHMSAWFRPQVYTKPFNISTANVSDTQPANSSIAFKHTQTQVGPLRTGSFEGIPSNGSGSVPVGSNIDVTAENKNATNVSPQFTTTEASFPADKPPIKKISFEQNGNEMVTVPVNHMGAWVLPRAWVYSTKKPFANISTANVSDTQPANSSIAFKHTQTQVGSLRTGSFEGIPSNGSGSVPVGSNIDVTAENKNATNVSPQLIATESSATTTQRSIIGKDSAIAGETTVPTELRGTKTTRKHSFDPANQIAITENVPKEHDVTGITGVDDPVHPSTKPSLEGQPEALSADAANGGRSMNGYYPVDNPMTLERHQPLGKNKENHQAIAESIKSFQELQLTPTTWTTQPVCFFGYPGQLFNKPSSAGITPYTGSFVPPSAQQDQRFPSQSSFRQTSPSQPNYMQVQAQTVQFLPRNNVGNRMQAQPTAQGIGPTGPATMNGPIFPMSQQPMLQQPASLFNRQPEMSNQPGSGLDIPYFCTYISMPTYNFPPIPGTSQSSRSSNADKVEPDDDSKSDSRKLMPISAPKDSFTEGKSVPRKKTYPWNYFVAWPKGACPEGYEQCDNRFCILKMKWCDGRVDCTDASDETNCSCTNRISQNRFCDGYFDCPNGEDEFNCSDCSQDFFDCGDLDRSYGCVPLTQRCDGVRQCLNGRDELDCNVLSPTEISENDIFPVGYTEGFLHKNIKGQWYPVCSNTSSWAIDACTSEIGQPLMMMPQMSFIQVPANMFQDLHVIEINGQIERMSCPGSAVFVKCPPLPCGTKNLVNNDGSLVSGNADDSKLYKRHSERRASANTQRHEVYQDTLDLLRGLRAIFNESQEDTLNRSQARVVGGHMSQPKAWPFLITIYKDGQFHCGGVILNEVYVLTAAHCMAGYKNHYYEVEAGVLRRFSFSPTAQLRKVTYVILHPSYEVASFHNDVALVMLNKPLLFNRWVRPICLPTVSTAGPEWEQGPTPQSICVVVGWGAVRELGPDPDQLQEVAVPILSSCKHLSDQTNSTICAGYSQGGYDACQGDSGGPLLCRNPESESQWYVAGVISHGDGCGRPNEPGVYTKVSSYVNWIQEIFKFGNSVSFYLYAHLQSLNKCTGFSCLSGSKKCLPTIKRCDGFVDCLHGEDEVDCRRYRSNSDNETGIDSNSNETVELDFRKKSAGATPVMSTIGNQTRNRNAETDTSTFPTLYELMETLVDEKNSSIADGNVTILVPTADSARLTFTCKRLLQTIEIRRRCDRRVDCEDGSDEDDCTCRDYLSSVQPSAICDGYLDCNDETDENDCGMCDASQFYCSESRTCIPISKKCDGKQDCSLGEDENDCLALSDGEYMDVDRDSRSVLRQEGLLSRYLDGKWHVQCVESGLLEDDSAKSRIGWNLCKYLGFANLQSEEKIVVYKTELKTRLWRNNATDRTPSYVEDEDNACETLWIRCRPVSDSSADTHMIVDPKTGSRNYLWPWLAAIFVDGRYHCSALLLEADWLLSSASCTNDIELSVNYTNALLGQSPSYLHVDGPYQQISVVDEIKSVSVSGLSLLHLKTAVNFTRHVQPLFSQKQIYPPAENDFCVAVGTNKEHVTQSIYLQPILKDCDKCYRCFVEAKNFECPINGTTSDWSGMVFCRGDNGWYPTATFHDEVLCSPEATRRWTSIDYAHAYLMQALEEKLQPTAEATCNGARCNTGRCIPWNRVCDGVTDCRDGADEVDEACDVKRTTHGSEMPRECTVSQLQCGNRQCVSKSDFCDGKVNCLDGTDEPVTCTCAEYLRLTAPKRLCDGVWHCLDKSDESPDECNCTESSFKCNAEGGNNATCISQDFVCDGNEDCPNGEDETECVKVYESADDKSGTGEVMQRSYGLWHSRCFSAPVTSSEEARSVCRKIGYADGSILRDNRNMSEPLVPSRDDFYMVRINPVTWVTMRGDRPLINLVRPKEACHRLLVSCS